MEITTTRFGKVRVSPDNFIKFSEGILGFSNLKHFIILDDPADEIFCWLQSCEEPKVAFPVLEPELITPSFSLGLNRRDLEALQLTDVSRARSFCIVTLTKDPTEMTANMKAPIVINSDSRLGRQCVLQDNDKPIKEKIFKVLQERLVQDPTKPIKGHMADLSVSLDPSPVSPADLGK